jgi:hypothetical protein
MEIVVRQMSGLGNQLFQYAAGKYFAAKYDARLRISVDPDRNAASYGSSRPFQLSAFRIATPMDVATAWERLACAQNPEARRIAETALRLLGARRWSEPEPYRFYPQLPFAKLPATVYLRAYFQAAGYAAAVEPSLRQELQLRQEPQGKDAAVLAAIAASPCPISVHLRRGDYTMGPKILALPLKYYQIAWQTMLSAFPAAEFFIFSDDFDCARAHLPQAGKRYFVDHNGTETAYQDLRLMAACHHHIIANSSFSWWGAWMNPRPDKMVLAPKYWHNTPQSYFPDLFPAGWRLLEDYDS